MTTIAAYKMDPKEDEILFGTQLKEGMWVLCEFPPCAARTAATRTAGYGSSASGR